MKKSPLIWLSIGIAFIIIIASFTNVVGIQTDESSNDAIIKDDVDQKELLFQTIIDIANDEEIQKKILSFKITRSTDRLFDHNMKLSVFSSNILTKNYLNNAYNIGLILSKTFSTSKIYSLFERYRVSNQEIFEEISATIEKNDTLNKKIDQLSDLPCDCEKDTALWNFPVLCTILYPLLGFTWMLVFLPWIIFGYEPYYLHNLYIILVDIGIELGCWWS